MKTFKDFIEEETPTVATGPAVDMGEPRMLFKKRDKRKKWDLDKMFKRANGKTR